MTPLIRTLLVVGVVTVPVTLRWHAPAAAQSPVPSSPPAPPVGQPPAIPWANKFFVPGIEKNPTQAAPPVIAHDFGSLPHGTLAVKTFSVTNIYDVPIQVVDIRMSCDCLKAYPPEKVLQPNEVAEFQVTMDTRKFKGPNAQTMHVTFGPQFVSTAILRLQADSRPDVSVTPGEAQFGAVALGAKPMQMVTVEYAGGKLSWRDWRVTEVVQPTGPFTVEVKEISRGFATGVKYHVNVTLKPDAPAGVLSESVALKTNDPAAPLVRINVAANIRPPISLSTDKVVFAKVPVGEVVEARVIVRAGRPFRIRPVADENDGLTVQSLQTESPTQVIVVKFEPSKAGVIRKEVLLTTDLGGPPTKLTIEAEAVGP